jgi:hypothetical protein
VALTRRFFTSLAADYRDIRPKDGGSAEYAVWAQMVATTAAALATNNAMFNHQRFYEACGVRA